jgi:hypothetical protein
VATAGWNELTEESDPDLETQTESIVKDIRERENKVLSDLCGESKLCSAEGCGRDAVTYRWHPEKGRAERRLFCGPHAEQFDRRTIDGAV